MSRPLSALLLLTLLICPHARAAEGFAVTAVDGTVLAWRPFARSWTAIKTSAQLPVGTLIQARARAALKMLPPGKSGKDAEIQLRLAGPMMLRLEATLAKSLTTTNLAISQKKESWPDGSGLNPGHRSAQPLDAAWRRNGLVSMILGTLPDDISPLFTAQVSEPALQWDAATDGIDLKTPSDGGVLIADRWPVSVPVTWTVRGQALDKATFEIYSRRSAAETPVLRRRTTTHSAVLTFAQPGTYYILITTPDGRFTSQEIVINIETPQG